MLLLSGVSLRLRPGGSLSSFCLESAAFGRPTQTRAPAGDAQAQRRAGSGRPRKVHNFSPFCVPERILMGMADPVRRGAGPTPVPRPNSPEDRLDSWKEIASYLGRSVRTVQQWERSEELPVHRLQHSRYGSVYTFRSELDTWRALRTALAEVAETVIPELGNEVEACATRETVPEAGRRSWKIRGSLVLGALAVVSLILVRLNPPARHETSYAQITNFTDSAVAPALSPDGRMVAFYRSNSWFHTPDQIYVKMLPNGEPVQLTHDPRLKYGLAFSPDGSRIAYTVEQGWKTFTVSPLGGDPSLLLSNAAGLTWLDERRVLFSAIQTGAHMGIVTALENRSEYRELYFPQHERAMALFLCLARSQMGGGGRNGSGLAAVPLDSTGWQLGWPPGRPARAMHLRGVVAGWEVDVFRR